MSHGISNCGVSWPWVAISALPGIGVFLGCYNQRSFIFQAYQDKNPVAQAKALSALSSSPDRSFTVVNAGETKDSTKKDNVIKACQREKMYAVAAIISHVTTLAILIILVSLGILSESYLALAIVNLGMFDHIKAYIACNNTVNQFTSQDEVVGLKPADFN